MDFYVVIFLATLPGDWIMTKFNLYDVVKLKVNKPEEDIHIGTTGTIVFMHTQKNRVKAYEVEFVNDSNKTITVTSVYPEEIEKIDTPGR